LFFIVTLVSSRYFIIGFKKLYGFEYRSLVETVSLTLKAPFPAYDGFIDVQAFNELIGIAVDNYHVINMFYFYYMIREWGSAFYRFSIPISMIIATVLFSAVLEVISVEKNIQFVALIGRRGYYRVIVTTAILLSVVYSALISIPLLVYGCQWCPRLWHVEGVISILLLLLFLILHLLEACTYTIARWSSMAGLIVGVILSLIFISPYTLSRLSRCNKGVFGLEPPGFESTLL
jgi:hypothetical protein